MTELFELLNNKLLFWSLISCLTAQVLKIVFNFFSVGELRIGIIFETGGMPSSHSALITSLTSGLGMDLGFDDPVFAIAVGISLIVMYDASGVRRSAGLNAKEVIKAEWLEGIPPVSKIIPTLSSPTERKLKNIFKTWAERQDIKLQKSSLLLTNSNNSVILIHYLSISICNEVSKR